MSHADVLVSVEGIGKKFGSRWVLRDVSCDVAAGESLAVTGPSGCGKSTLLNILGLLETPSEGRVCVSGKPYPGMNSAAATRLRRKDISYLFQSYALIDSLSAIENILLGMRYLPGGRGEKIKNAYAVMERLGVAHVAKEKVSTLSGGEQLRVALTRSIIKPSRVILADEPTGALDAHMAGIAMDEILQLQSEYGKALIVVTHDPAIAARCTKQLALNPSV